LTGRRERFSSLRQYGGLSGFCAPRESPYDAFVSGHSGNSISAALGMSLAGQLANENYQVAAVIGDGSLGAGMAFEAVNHAGHLGKKLIVILNDNGMSISPSVGALARWLSRVKLDSRYAHARQKMKSALNHLPFGDSAWTLSKRMKESMERAILPNAFWEELGFSYLGPLDGHNLRELEAVLARARDLESGPVIVHILTRKGKGYPEAESDAIKYHGISPRQSIHSSAPSYSRIFGDTIRDLLKQNEKLVVISAAMLDGTGLTQAAAEFPERVFDVGICEQHAVTLAAGLAARGFIPVVAIYSTFLQRAYDQIVHDVCLPGLPVVFAIDRAGIVGEDGKTHQGAFDVSFLRCLPNMAIASPADENDLRNLIFSALRYRQPAAIRYPRGCGQGVDLTLKLRELAVGKAEKVRSGRDLTILSLGPLTYCACEAAGILAQEGLDCSVVNARFAKPLDAAMILAEAEKTRNLLTVEENALCGGFGSAVLELLAERKLTGIKTKRLGLPDSFIEHGPQEIIRSLHNLDSEGIVQTIRSSFPELFSRTPIKIQEEA
jgi:1-deoxy-D-xylulose-5-phosphate synthase